jgi:hypothetical protein
MLRKTPIALAICGAFALAMAAPLQAGQKDDGQAGASPSSEQTGAADSMHKDKNKNKHDAGAAGQAGAPGQADTAPGQAGTAPGQAGTTPGQADTAPGQAGTTPGQAGTAPGQGKDDSTGQADPSAGDSTGQQDDAMKDGAGKDGVGQKEEGSNDSSGQKDDSTDDGSAQKDEGADSMQRQHVPDGMEKTGATVR